MRVAFLPLLLALPWAQASPATRCRCLSTQPCWPSASAFAALASKLSQPLLHPVPPESACYPASAPAGNCTAVLAGTLDGRWRSDQAGSMQAPNWEAYITPSGAVEACYLNTTLGAPCKQGSVPVLGVDARTPGDVQAGVKFAAEHDLRLVIKNTGHDFLGRSTARGAFLLWTHHMKNISFHDGFTPASAPKSESYAAATLGAGVQWHEAYDAANATGVVLVGGIVIGGTVGAAGGWIQGGGHSVLSPSYGLGVDNVLQFTVVIASGAELTVSAHQHPRLFWALRGGGGGTFGVVTSVTYRTHAPVPIAGAFFLANASSRAPFRSMLTELLQKAPALTDAGWGGYTFGDPGANALQFFYAGPMSMEHANATIGPLFAYAASLKAQGLDVQSYLVPFDSFYSWYNFIFAQPTGPAQVGGNLEISSRLLSRSLLTDEAEKAADTLLALPSIGWNMVAGGAVNRVDPDDAGLNPAWRSAVMELTVGVGWSDGASAAEIEVQRTELKRQTALLSELSSANYFNEASLYEVDFKTAFFGTHYDKLKSIKRFYDPRDLFVVAAGVGSEDWNTDLVCQV